MEETTGAAGSLPRRLRDARRALGLSQSALAREVDCRQSAVSMMERGHAAALSRSTLERIAQRLGVALEEASPDGSEGGVTVATGRPYCSNPDCPSNLPLAVGDTVVFWPTPQPGTGAYCGFCGEVLETCCPNSDCRAPVPQGACCMRCGTSLVPSPREALADPEGWTAARRRRLAEWRALM